MQYWSKETELLVKWQQKVKWVWVGKKKAENQKD